MSDQITHDTVERTAEELVDLTCDRRAARYEEIAGWWAAVATGDQRFGPPRLDLLTRPDQLSLRT